MNGSQESMLRPLSHESTTITTGLAVLVSSVKVVKSWSLPYRSLSVRESTWKVADEVSVREVNLDVCKAPLIPNAFSKASQIWQHSFTCKQAIPTFTPSHRASPPFGCRSFYHPTEGRRLSWPVCLVTYRNEVLPPGVESGHGHPSQY